MVVGGNVLVRGVPVDRHLHLRVSVRVVAEFGGQHLLEVLKGPLNADSKYSHALQNKEARDVTEEQRRRFRRVFGVFSRSSSGSLLPSLQKVLLMQGK